jgi:hypothetical protein
MAPGKKMAKKAAKKVAKKAAKKSAHHHESRDVRRAYEHLGRVEILQRAFDESDADISMLVSLAQSEVKAGQSRNAADLLRGAEHLSFAGLAKGRGGSRVSEELEREILAEVDHMTRKAADHAEEEGERYEQVATLSRVMLNRAHNLIAKGAYRPALELARGAEALAHVMKLGTGRLESGRSPGRLRGSLLKRESG